MATDLTDFSALTPDLVETARSRIRGWLAAFRPDVDASGGLVGNLIVELLGVNLASVDDRIDQFRKTGSLAVAATDPDAFDSESLDALLSNFRLTRSSGRKATGRVTLIVRSLLPVNIPSGFAFQAGNGTFVTAVAFAARVSADQIVEDTDRLLTPTGDGRYSFTIEVEATEEGPTGLVSRGTAVIPQAALTGVTEAYAADDFVGGLSEETNAELAQRALSGISGRSPANRIGLIAAITQDSAVGQTVSAVSVIGFGDEEQRRYHGLRPIAYGGRCDVYIRPSGGSTDQTHEVTASLTEFDDVTAIWSVTLPTDIYGGAYGVVRVAASADPTEEALTIQDVVTSWTPDDYIDVESAEEAKYSSLQTARVVFEDPSTDTTTEIGSTRTVFVTVRRAIGVNEAQALVSDPDTRPTAGDILVRAAVPCWVRFSMVIDIPPATTVDSNAVQAAVAAAVEDTGFNGRLNASKLVGAVNSVLGDGQAVSDWTLQGVIDVPDGSQLLLSDKAGLSIPWRPEIGVSFRTSSFFITSDRVAYETRGVEQ